MIYYMELYQTFCNWWYSDVYRINESKNTASLIIQSNYRMYKEKQRFCKFQKNIIVIQQWWKKYLQSKQKRKPDNIKNKKRKKRRRCREKYM